MSPARSRSLPTLLGWLCLASSAAALQEPTPLEDAVEIQEAVDDEAQEIRTSDAALAERLRSILDAVDGLREIRPRVEAGVVVLTGFARTREDVDRVVALAEKLDGTLLVVDEVEVERDLTPRLRDTWRDVQEKGRDLVASLPLFATAGVMLAGFWLLARLLRDVDFPYRPLRRRELLENLVRQTAFVAVLAVGAVVVLRFLGATALLGTILGAAGVVGLALGFAFRNVVENYLAGILLAVRQPFHARDLVDVEGARGTVLRMTASETILMDANGNHVRLPNATIFNGQVVNFTRNPLRRFTVAVGVGTEVDLEAAQDLGLDVLNRMNGVIDDPAPSSRIAGLGDSSVTLEFFGWVDQRAASFIKVSSESHRLIKEAFDEAAVDMPAPTYQVLFDELPRAGGRAASDAEPKEPAAPSTGPSPEEIDVAPTNDLARQIDAEVARSDEPNLLEDERDDA